MSSDILTYHGVKGMRWGHRKQEHTNATLSKTKDDVSKQETRKKILIGAGVTAGILAATATGAYADMLKKHGYSGVNDLNLPEPAARVLFDKSAVAIR